VGNVSSEGESYLLVLLNISSRVKGIFQVAISISILLVQGLTTSMSSIYFGCMLQFFRRCCWDGVLVNVPPFGIVQIRKSPEANLMKGPCRLMDGFV
jgi:hypothetical protein